MMMMLRSALFVIFFFVAETRGNEGSKMDKLPYVRQYMPEKKFNADREENKNWYVGPLKDMTFQNTSDWPDRLSEMLERFHNHRGLKSLISSMESLHSLLSQNESERARGDKKDLVVCTRDTIDVMKAALRFNTSALKMLDSNGNRESGFLVGNREWTGSYWECVNTVFSSRIDGQWCEVYMGRKYADMHYGFPIGLSVGVCFPSTCTEKSLEMVFSYLGSNVGASNRTTIFPVRVVSCPKPPSSLSPGDIVAIVITSILVVLMIAATSYDLYIRMKNNTSEGVGAKLLLSFSLYTNTKKIIDMTQREKNMSVLDGIRFITMTWVILGHIVFFPAAKRDNTSQANYYPVEHPAFQTVVNATYSVDTFFCLSGFLVSLLTLRQLKKTRGRMNVPLAYLHRYIRLTPAYAYVILFAVSFYAWIGRGPFYNEAAEQLQDVCSNGWWSNLLYISNFYPFSMCIAWSWYLANDMQFYLLSPFILMILYRWRKVGVAVMFYFLLGDMITTGTLVSINDLPPDMLGSLLMFSRIASIVSNSTQEVTMNQIVNYDMYTKPYTRIGAYIVGMMAGYIIYQTKGKIKMPWWGALLGWIVSAATALAILYGLTDPLKELRWVNHNLSAFYVAMSRPVWSACIGWVIVACLTGYGGPITTLLSWKVFLPLSRLTYCAYLIHPLVITWFMATQEEETHFLVGNVVYYHLSTVMLSYGCAFILSVMVEGPFIGVQKTLLGFCIKRTVQEKKEDIEVGERPAANEKSNGNIYNNDVVISNPNVASKL